MTDEEMAKEYTKENLCKKCHSHCKEGICTCTECKKKTFRDGAEFGYNKANEWCYVKNGDLPNKELEEKQLLVRVRNYTKDCIFAYYILDKYYSKNGKRFYFDINCDYPIDIDDIIAWKEIVLPKESD